ncbi:MAG: hypothetical protein A2233_00035 [Candidatus Kerfeldbacteria bacterium RIFOXYA2_FULL_38_24]|uniref:DUF6938 domain-containing protein n=1 Tax=Candidatus Kerfeldbacteria bacterium RIFOXYB2_FULL_38_14 TaxID=1798547 RepID=A0A1G2B9U4_9BACT|nr:MAG: hypothetical protein A2233_00035 [Candidatus Kerfeldbacteria bacterium RIFOXYA2_FULL_38_24]OGY85983.1 MAG: hypothetical protein A2319_00240 [Candidatus Kerfeldbacteria bacterium RIFOXYB2_FULL_38_14]
MNQLKKKFEKAYIVTVDMGYGHQRAVYPFMDIAACPVDWDGGEGKIITANNYPGIPKSDRRNWDSGRSLYEHISRMKHLPLVGNWIFGAMDKMQSIAPFYPKRDLSHPSLQVRQNDFMLRHGWGKHLIEILNKNPLPYITSFFSTAFFADYHGYKGEIYCICTDSDVSRAWVPLAPAKSRIKYLAPNRRVKERLKLYGVKAENIYITGFPLPKENIGSVTSAVLKKSIGYRLTNLDPEKRYLKKYHHTLEYYLGKEYCEVAPQHPLTITFAVGGAGAQREIGTTILKSLRKHIAAGRVRLNLAAGVRNDVYRYYAAAVKEFHLNTKHQGEVHIIYDNDKMDYFAQFNKALLTTDILWTKPSELSFYAGLGLPIIIAPSVGSQEDYNRSWLYSLGAGFDQEDPQYTHEWLFDWLASGWLAQAAMEGFLDAPRNGVYHIEDIVLRGQNSEIDDMHLL